VIIHNEQYHYQPQDVHVRRRHATILQEQSKGGAKARGKAEGVAPSPRGKEKTQHRDKAQQQEKGQSQQGPEGTKPQKKKGQDQEKGQEEAP